MYNGEERCTQSLNGERREKKNHVEELGIDGRKILNACSRNKIRAWTALIWFRKGTNVDFLMKRRAKEK